MKQPLRFAVAQLLVVGLFIYTAFMGAAWARGSTYGLSPDEVAPGVYVLWGLQEQLTPRNGGNVVNIAFIVGDDAVLVVDTGPTQYYAEELIRVIRSITDKPIRQAVVTHHHFDHSYGMAAFKKINTPVLMHRNAAPLLARDGEAVLNFMTVVIGNQWTSRLKIVRPTQTTWREKTFNLGNRIVRVTPFEFGHTPGDLVVFDQATETLFASDLVFRNRAPSVPHANIDVWLQHLDRIATMRWRRLVPGHGPMVNDPDELADLRDYLGFLRDYAQAAARRGDTLAESIGEANLDQYKQLETVQIEFQRSMFTLFRQYEAEDLDSATPAY